MILMWIIFVCFRNSKMNVASVNKKSRETLLNLQRNIITQNAASVRFVAKPSVEDIMYMQENPFVKWTIR